MNIGETKREYEAELQAYNKWLRIAGVLGVLFLAGAIFTDGIAPEDFALLLVVLGSGLLGVAGILYAYSRGTLRLLKQLESNAEQNNTRR